MKTVTTTVLAGLIAMALIAPAHAATLVDHDYTAPAEFAAWTGPGGTHVFEHVVGSLANMTDYIHMQDGDGASTPNATLAFGQDVSVGQVDFLMAGKKFSSSAFLQIMDGLTVLGEVRFEIDNSASEVRVHQDDTTLTGDTFAAGETGNNPFAHSYTIGWSGDEFHYGWTGTGTPTTHDFNSQAFIAAGTPDSVRLVTGFGSATLASNKHVYLDALSVNTSGVTTFADNFETFSGSGTSTVALPNAWVGGSGGERRDYNVDNSVSGGMDATGLLVIQDLDGDERGNNTPHGGFFDSVFANMPTVSLNQTYDQITFKADVQVFAGDYTGANIDDVTDGIRIAISDSTNSDMGYGMFIATGTASSNTLREMSGLSGTVIGSALALDVDESGFATIIIQLLRTDAGVLISASIDGNEFIAFEDTTSAFTSFDTLGFTVADSDHGLKIDNVSVVYEFIPTPAALPAGLALIGLIAARRRR